MSFWTRWMYFYGSCRKIFDSGWKQNAASAKKVNIYVLLQAAKIFPQNAVFDNSMTLLTIRQKSSDKRAKISAQWTKETETFAKFPTNVSSHCSCGHAKRNFDILARIFIQKAENFFFSVQTCWRKKPSLFRKFFSNGSSKQVESSLLKLAKKMSWRPSFFLAQFPNLRTINFFAMKNSFLKTPFSTSRYLFWHPTGLASRKNRRFLAQAENILRCLFSPTLRCFKTTDNFPI